MPPEYSLAGLEAAVLAACAVERVWPARISAGICAAVDFAIAHPEVADTLASERVAGGDGAARYESFIGRLAEHLRVRAPVDKRLPGATDEALIGGLVGLIGDHVRIGRLHRLAALKPELVLLTLLPYLGFSEAQSWANKI